MAAPGQLAQALLARLAKDGPLLTALSLSSAATQPTDAAVSIQTIGVGIPSQPTPTPAALLASVVTSTMAAAATTAAAAVAAAVGAPTDGPSKNTGECRLLGPFAIVVQLALGGLALLALVYKRWRERPQRPLQIWFFDVSKQVVGSMLVHVANVFMSMLTSGRLSIKLEPAAVAAGQRLLRRAADDYVPNPCSFYLLNLAIDTTLGIPILILLLRISTGMASYTSFGQPPQSIQSGNYGSPPRAWWWFKQSILYFCGLFGMKVCVLVIFLMLPWISRLGDWALTWTEGNEQLQIVFVMMLFPLIMNALQYYIIDSFIKEQQPAADGDGAAAPEHRSGLAYDHVPDGADDDDGAASDEEELAETGKPVPEPRDADREYDPDIDGNSQTVAGNGSSRRARPGRALPKELYPHE